MARRAALDRETKVRSLPPQFRPETGRTYVRAGTKAEDRAEATPGEMRRAVSALLDSGLSYAEIARRLGVVKATVAFHARRLDVPIDSKYARRYDWEAIRTAYNGGLSMSECMDRFGFSKYAWYDAIRRGDIVPRPVTMPLNVLLVKGRPQTNRTHLKSRLLRAGLKANRCELCGITEWRGKPLSMQLHHLNGDGSDNRLENLQLLCGNCHSQTDTYGGRNGHRRRARA